MPTLTVNGRAVTVDDSFTKLSPAEQNAAVDHIAKSMPPAAAEKGSGVGSGVGSGFMHGVAGLARDTGATLKTFAGVDTGLDNLAGKIEPKEHKSAPLIREGGSFLNKDDYNPSALPQILAEQAPGVGQDLLAMKVVGKANKWAGLAAGVGSSLLRTLGPMAKENSKARTGDENAEVTGDDKTRALLTSAVQAPLTAVGLSRFAPGAGKAAGVGLEGTGNALKKYLGTVGTEAVTGAGRDAIGQVGTSVGQEHGQAYDPNRTAEAAITGAAGSGLLAAPKLAGNVNSATKFREFGGANAEAATALANRQAEAADGKALVGPIGGTKTAAHAVAAAHKDVHTELSAAAKGEVELSTGNANTLQRIKDGGKASASELEALGTEVAPTTLHLARQALLSSKLKSMGNFSEDAFTGGLSGKMESLRPINNPVGTGVAMGATALAGHAGGLGMLGTFAPQVIGGIVAGYGGARMIDKLTGARSPAKGFQDKFADPNAAPVMNPDAPAPALPPQRTTSVPQVTPPQDTSLWGNVAEKELKYNPRPNIMIDEGIGKAVKQIQAAKQKQLLADVMPALRDLAATAKPPTPEAPPAPPDINPTALKMVQQKMKQGLPPEPVVAPPVAPVAPVEAAPAKPSFHPTALKMLQQKLKAGLPAAAEAPAIATRALAEPGPASPEIAAVMQKLQAQAAPAAAPAAPAPIADAPPMAPQAPPVPPRIAKITKKLKEKKVVETAAVDEQVEGTDQVKRKIAIKPIEDEYIPIPEEGLWRKRLSNDEVIAKELDSYSPALRKKYGKNIGANRDAKRDLSESIANDHTPADAKVAAEMYHQLDTISRRDEAAKALKYYQKRMSPKARKATKAYFTPKKLEDMWKTK